MLKTDLDIWEKLLDQLEIYKDEGPPDRLPKIMQWNIRLQSASLQLRQLWLEQAFRTSKEDTLLRYIRFLQSGITRLSDKVAGLLSDNNYYAIPSTAWGRSVQNFLMESEQLLNFLQEHFYRHFDWDYPLSRYQCKAQLADIRVSKETIYANLTKLRVDPEMIVAINESIQNKIRDIDTDRYSYHQINAVNVILREFGDLTIDASLNTEQITLELIRLRFNTINFITWYKDRFDTQLLARTSKTEKQRCIIDQIKTVKTVSGSSRKAFEDDLPAVGQEIVQWLQQYLNSYDDRHIKPNLRAKSVKPIALTCSVTQLAFIVRLFYLQGYYLSRNISEILRFYTHNYATKRQAHISFKSFAHAFYGADQSTAASVRGMLQSMINQIDKLYFPR